MKAFEQILIDSIVHAVKSEEAVDMLSLMEQYKRAGGSEEVVQNITFLLSHSREYVRACGRNDHTAIKVREENIRMWAKTLMSKPVTEQLIKKLRTGIRIVPPAEPAEPQPAKRTLKKILKLTAWSAVSILVFIIVVGITYTTKETSSAQGEDRSAKPTIEQTWRTASPPAAPKRGAVYKHGNNQIDYAIFTVDAKVIPIEYQVLNFVQDFTSDQVNASESESLRNVVVSELLNKGVPSADRILFVNFPAQDLQQGDRTIGIADGADNPTRQTDYPMPNWLWGAIKDRNNL